MPECLGGNLTLANTGAFVGDPQPFTRRGIEESHLDAMLARGQGDLAVNFASGVVNAVIRGDDLFADAQLTAVV